MSKWRRRKPKPTREKPKDWSGDRWSEDWDHCDPETLEVADRLFEELHAVMHDLLRGLDIESGIRPDARAVNITVPSDELSRWSWDIDNLDGCTMGDAAVTSLQFLRSPEASRPISRGTELAQVFTEWDIIKPDGTTHTARRIVRLSCAKQPEYRELSVDLIDNPLFHERRWSAYLGFVQLNSNTMRYRTPSRPEGLSDDQLAAIGFSCTLTIRATIENLNHLRTTFGKGASEREMDEISDVLSEI